MATIECDFCDDEQAVFLLNNLDSGDVARIGAACWPGFIMAMAEGLIGEVPTDGQTDATDVVEPSESTDGEDGANTAPGESDAVGGDSDADDDDETSASAE